MTRYHIEWATEVYPGVSLFKGHKHVTAPTEGDAIEAARVLVAREFLTPTTAIKIRSVRKECA